MLLTLKNVKTDLHEKVSFLVDNNPFIFLISYE